MLQVMADLSRLYRGKRLLAPHNSGLRTVLRPEGLREYAELHGENDVLKEALEAASTVRF